MTQSISINQKMRDEIVHKLTVQAVADAAAAFKTEFKRQNDAFWARHQAHIDKLTGLTKKKQRELIQAGVIRGVSIVRPQVSQHDENADRTRWFLPFKDLMRDREAKLLVDTGLFDTSFGPLGNAHMGDPRLLCFIFKSQGAVPLCDDIEYIEPGAHEQDMLALAQSMTRILESARAFRSEAMSILTSCRTSRQLDDLWPEASKLVPKRQNVGKSMVPQDAIDRVRDQLANGIPAEA